MGLERGSPARDAGDSPGRYSPERYRNHVHNSHVSQVLGTRKAFPGEPSL